MVNTPFLNQTKTRQLPGGRPGESFHCYQITILTGNHTGIWQEVNPISNALPIFITQLIIITSLSRILLFLLKPFRQPRIVAEIIAGGLGPSVMGKLKKHSPFLDAVFSVPSSTTLETMGNIGLIYSIFLLGLEMDITTITRVEKKSFAVAFTGTLFPFLIGLASYYLLHPNFGNEYRTGPIVWGASLTVTSLPVITEILAKLKLLSTDIGKTAMSTALVNTITSWVLVTVMMAIGSNLKKAPWALISTLGFVLFCAYVIRPIIIWTIHRTQKGGSYSEETICIILTAVLGCGLATDLLGTSSMLGAFVLGIVIPNGLLGPRFLEVLKGFVEDLLMPVFFTASGMRTNLGAVVSSCSWVLVAGVISLACMAKVVSTVVVSLLYGMRIRDGVALGVLMNTKGLLALIAINSGRDNGMIEDKAFTVMFLSILLMTMATQPILSSLYKPKIQFLPNKHRALQRLKPNAELRILACVHEPHSVPAIINLLEVSNPSRRSPIAIFALHLIQLTGHTTALLIVHGPTKSITSEKEGYNRIHQAFEQFEEEHDGVSVQPLTAVSPYGTMHEDICSIAEDKRVTLIILPYHKRQTIHNKMEEISHAYKDVNDNVLANSPCSVGILVDRGFGKSTAAEDGGHDSSACHIAMLFIGGADDREALLYAKKMAGNPTVTLTVVRFVHSTREVTKLSDFIEAEDDQIHSKMMDSQVENRLDESHISEFRHRTTRNRSIVYFEKAVRNGAETIEIVRSMGQGYDLFVVGRGMRKSSWSPVTAGIDDWSECLELGPMGDLLVTAEFSSTVSVLVVQQYDGGRGEGGSSGDGVTMNTPSRPSESSHVPFVKRREVDEGY